MRPGVAHKVWPRRLNHSSKISIVKVSPWAESPGEFPAVRRTLFDIVMRREGIRGRRVLGNGRDWLLVWVSLPDACSEMSTLFWLREWLGEVKMFHAVRKTCLCKDQR